MAGLLIWSQLKWNARLVNAADWWPTNNEKVQRYSMYIRGEAIKNCKRWQPTDIQTVCHFVSQLDCHLKCIRGSGCVSASASACASARILCWRMLSPRVICIWLQQKSASRDCLLYNLRGVYRRSVWRTSIFFWKKSVFSFLPLTWVQFLFIFCIENEK